MHRAFRLNPTEFPHGFLERGREIYQTNKRDVEECLSAFITEGEINGSLLRDHWFPEVQADVFISHSHEDEDKAVALSGWLNAKFGIDSFIDSAVWGYSDALLGHLDKQHCWQERTQTYNYHRRNGTTSHVHMMLSTALSRMINACECVIFVSSPNSVSTSENLGEQVSSPWIFYELSQMAVIQKRPIQDYRMSKTAGDHQFSSLDESADGKALKIRYDVDFDSLTSIDHRNLNAWAEEYQKRKSRLPHALDYLYEIAPHKSTITDSQR